MWHSPLRRVHAHRSGCLLISACGYSENILNPFCLKGNVTLGSKPDHPHSTSHHSPPSHIHVQTHRAEDLCGVVCSQTRSQLETWEPEHRHWFLFFSPFLPLSLSSLLFSLFFTGSHTAHVGFKPHLISPCVHFPEACATTPGKALSFKTSKPCPPTFKCVLNCLRGS